MSEISKEEMEKIELELREYANKGPSLSRKSAGKAAILLNDYHRALYGRQLSIIPPTTTPEMPKWPEGRNVQDMSTSELAQAITRIEEDREAFPSITNPVLDMLRAFLSDQVAHGMDDDVRRPD